MSVSPVTINSQSRTEEALKRLRSSNRYCKTRTQDSSTKKHTASLCTRRKIVDDTKSQKSKSISCKSGFYVASKKVTNHSNAILFRDDGLRRVFQYAQYLQQLSGQTLYDCAIIFVTILPKKQLSLARLRCACGSETERCHCSYP